MIDGLFGGISIFWFYLEQFLLPLRSNDGEKGDFHFLFKVNLKVSGVFFALVTLGIALQWKGIYYFYASHDPSAYLNGAQHLARKGTFSHHDELTELAYGKGQDGLKVLIQDETAPEGWMLTRNYGLISSDLSTGKRFVSRFFWMSSVVSASGQAFWRKKLPPYSMASF